MMWHIWALELVQVVLLALLLAFVVAQDIRNHQNLWQKRWFRVRDKFRRQ